MQSEKELRTKAASFMAGLAFATAALVGPAMMVPEPALAADGAAIGKCLLKSCQGELASCITNPGCLANLVCIQTCNGKADESACQIGCGDVFDNAIIGKFNDCAVSQKGCVPQRPNDDAWPEPRSESLVKSFDTKVFQGRWYISAGLNQIFDTFPCQVHFFEAPGPGLLYGKLNWRVVEPDGEFLSRNAVQRFKQDPQQPGILYNHDNDYLHYQDDWYILDSETGGKDGGKDDFILVYYRGRNDAWDGYGGAVLYTRAPDTPASIEPRVTEACAKAQVPALDYKLFLKNDNSCKATADAAEVLRLREQYAKKELLLGESAVQQRLTAERQLITSTVVADEQKLSSDAAKAVSRLEDQLATYEKKLEQGLEKEVAELEKDVESLEKEFESELFGKKAKK